MPIQVTIDWFSFITGLISIIGFILSIVFYYQSEKHKNSEEILKHQLEAGLIGVIMNLDTLSSACGNTKNTHQTLVGMTVILRSQAIALLKSFSDANKRFPTYDFGIDGKSRDEILEKRQTVLGEGVTGCIVEDQTITMSNGSRKIQHLQPNDVVMSYSFTKSEVVPSRIVYTSAHQSENYIELNGILHLTANHELYVKEKGWIRAVDIMLGDEIMKIDRIWVAITSIKFIEGNTLVYDVKVNGTECLFVSNYLVHNAGKVSMG